MSLYGCKCTRDDGITESIFRIQNLIDIYKPKLELFRSSTITPDILTCLLFTLSVSHFPNFFTHSTVLASLSTIQ